MRSHQFPNHISANPPFQLAVPVAPRCSQGAPSAPAQGQEGCWGFITCMIPLLNHHLSLCEMGTTARAVTWPSLLPVLACERLRAGLPGIPPGPEPRGCRGWRGAQPARRYASSSSLVPVLPPELPRPTLVFGGLM